ncbi:hypothetical protein M407DRAFT_68764, partial [Tulasnella calospora MUT 4182]
IPTDFDIVPGGQQAKALSYINNIELDHKELYSVIEEVVGKFCLLWDRVLTDVYPGNGGMIYRITGSYEWNADPAGPEPEWRNKRDPSYAAWKEWRNKRELVLPSVPEQGYTEDISHREIHYKIQGKKVQVIVNPSYPGGSWHAEGMASERIVASGIYCYDSENLTDGHLALRMAASGVNYPHRHQAWKGIEKVWGLNSESRANQVIGTAKTTPKRCIAFPNIYQYCVSPFALADPNKPGYRKIMTLFLVDPEQHIPSTSDIMIPPQQMHWAQVAMATSETSSAFSLLPAELHQMVAASTDGLISEAEAKDYRLKLMD